MSKVWCVECSVEKSELAEQAEQAEQEDAIAMLRQEAVDAMKRYVRARTDRYIADNVPPLESGEQVEATEPVQEQVQDEPEPEEEEGKAEWYGYHNLIVEVTEMIAGWDGDYQPTDIFLGERQVAVLREHHPRLFDPASGVRTFCGLYVFQDAAHDCIAIR